ncbi:MAG: DUF3516 domain-containing protein, partial [Acidimicrobiales bacterium]
ILDDWERLRMQVEELVFTASTRPAIDEAPPPISANRRAFRVTVRNAAFRRVELVAAHDWTTLGELDGEAGWDAATWLAAMEPYFEEHPTLGIGPEARSPALFQVTELDDGGPGSRWRVRQVLDDPDAFHEWAIVLELDVAESDVRGVAVVRPLAVEQL